MNREEAQLASILHELQERAKELNCLYQVDELLNRADLKLEDVLRGIVEILPPGWQYPQDCQARIVLEDRAVASANFQAPMCVLSAPIVIKNENVGSVEVSYRQQMPRADEGAFLKEERKLINTIADRVADHIMQRRLKTAFASLSAAADGHVPPRGEWRIVLDFLRDTDPVLLQRISRKLVNHLACNGVTEAKRLLQHSGIARAIDAGDAGGENRPIPRDGSAFNDLTSEAFRIANERLEDAEILECVTTWIKEEKSGFLVRALEQLDTPLGEIIEAVERFRHTISTRLIYPCPFRRGCAYR